MSWHFSQALVEEFLAQDCLDGESCVQLKSDRIAEKSYYGNKKKAALNLSQSGITCKPLTAFLGVVKWILLLEDFHARDIVLQENNSENVMNVTSGQIPFALLEKSDPDGYFWKTCQISLLSNTLEPFLETYPKAGMMQDGKLYQRQKWELPISEIESGLWPTYSSQGWRNEGSVESINRKIVEGILTPEGAKQMIGGKHPSLWATPNTLDSMPPKSPEALYKEATVARPGRSLPANLRDQVGNMKLWQTQMWPTPSATDYMPQSPLPETINAQEGNPSPRIANKMWSTPSTQEIEHPHMNITLTGQRITLDGSDSHSMGLADEVKKWPTPRTQMVRNGTGNEERNKCNLEEEVGGQLNPNWVEWLMGWPIGWTNLNDFQWNDWWNDKWWETDPATLELPINVLVPRIAKDIPYRIDKLQALGEGQVPLCVAIAWNILK